MWTLFWDMHSGGSAKEKWTKIYIEADEEEAKVIFYNRFGHNPKRVTCTCCGEDYSISSDKDLAQLSGYHRNCNYLVPKNKDKKMTKKEQEVYYRGYYVEKGKKPPRGFTLSEYPPWGKYLTLEQYLKSKDVKFIYAKDIKPSEREGDVPEQGYVWV